jgi:hypothetical protein
MFTRSAVVSAVPPVPQSEFASQVKAYAISLVVLRFAIAVALAAACAAASPPPCADAAAAPAELNCTSRIFQYM